MIGLLPTERHAGPCEAMLSLGTISLDRTSIDLIAKETNMTLESIAEFYKDTKMSQLVREWGRQEGLEQGRRETLATLLRHRFGNDPRLTAIAARMAHAVGAEASVEMISAVGSLEDLVSRLPEL